MIARALILVAPFLDFEVLWEEMVLLTASYAGIMLIEYFVQRHLDKLHRQAEVEVHSQKLEMEHRLWLQQQSLVAQSDTECRQLDLENSKELAMLEGQIALENQRVLREEDEE